MASSPIRLNQERYLLAEIFTDPTYHIPVSYRLSGTLDPDRLRQALRDTLAAHEILRTRFTNTSGGFVAHVSASPAEVEIDIRKFDRDDPEELRRLFIDTFYRPMDGLRPEELIRLQLITLPGDELLLNLSLHHAIADGVSVNAFVQELFARYNGDTPAPVAEYSELIKKLQPTAEDATFWADRLSGLDEVTEVPGDVDREQTPQERRIPCRGLDAGKLRACAQQIGVSQFALASTLSAAVFAKYAGSEEVIMTFQSAGRRFSSETAGVIGPFSNSLPLRCRLRPDASVAELAHRQADEIAAALAHEAHPYHLIVRETGAQPKFGINFYPDAVRPEVDGARITDVSHVYWETNYDVDLRFIREDCGLSVYGCHNGDKISLGRVEAMLDDLALLLERIAETPELSVGALFPAPASLVAPRDHSPPQERLFDAFLAQAAAHPDRLALCGHHRDISYGELEEASAWLARRLVAAGHGPGSRIAIFAERGPQLVWTMLAVLRIGATMVPLDADYPEDRLEVLLRVSRPDALILPRRGKAPEWAAGVAEIHAAIDETAPLPDPSSISAETLAAGDPGAPAYILFTSGSTGTPKGVATSHRPVLNFLAWQRRTFALHPEDRFTNLNGVAHDMMIRDIFAPLSIGASLAIPRQAEIYQPGRLLDWAREQNPTRMHLTPAMGNLLTMAAGNDARLELTTMFFGGDRLPMELCEKMSRVSPGVEIVNFYGATETPQAATFNRGTLDEDWRFQPIGRGIDHFDIRITGPDRAPVSPGGLGEIAILSPHLSLGYVEESEIMPHDPPDIYYTGDLGFELPDSRVMFVGRKDDQVNIRGYRIELGDVIRAIKTHPDVEDAHVAAETRDAQTRLVAWVAGQGLNDDALYGFLISKLPQYMVPSDILCLDKLPLLPNGKLDRAALRAMPRPERKVAEGREPRTETERALARVWKEHMGLEAISIDDSFSSLRGDSLTFVQVLLASEAIVGELPEGWEVMPLWELAEAHAGPVGLFKWIDTTMIVRAISIVLVVAFHLGIVAIGGATSALFLVSGYLMGKLQIREAFRSWSLLPMRDTLVRVFVPSILFVAVYCIYLWQAGKDFGPALPLFYLDFIDLFKRAESGAYNGYWYLWYICAFLHILIFLVLALTLNFRFRLTQSPKVFLATLAGVAMLLKFGLPYLAGALGMVEPGREMERFTFTPTAHLSTVLLGMMIGYVSPGRERQILALAIAAYGMAILAVISATVGTMVILFGWLLLFVPQLPFPRLLHGLVLVLSGSSLFVYLTHTQFGQLFTILGVPQSSPMLLALCVASGIGLWLLWQRIVSLWRNWSA